MKKKLTYLIKQNIFYFIFYETKMFIHKFYEYHSDLIISSMATIHLWFVYRINQVDNQIIFTHIIVDVLYGLVLLFNFNFQFLNSCLNIQMNFCGDFTYSTLRYSLTYWKYISFSFDVTLGSIFVACNNYKTNLSMISYFEMCSTFVRT